MKTKFTCFTFRTKKLAIGIILSDWIVQKSKHALIKFEQGYIQE
jgi:hypothetical protein